MKYYKNNRNTQNEIKLIGRNSGYIYNFRHYSEFGTNDDKWLNDTTGTLLNTAHLLKYYEIPDSIFIKRSDVSDYIKQNIDFDNTVIFDDQLGNPIIFSVHEFLISKSNNKSYTLQDIIACEYKPHKEGKKHG